MWKLRNDTLCVGPHTECPLRDAECVRDRDVEAIGALRMTAGTKSSRMQDRNMWNIPADGHRRSHSAVGICGPQSPGAKDEGDVTVAAISNWDDHPGPIPPLQGDGGPHLCTRSLQQFCSPRVSPPPLIVLQFFCGSLTFTDLLQHRSSSFILSMSHPRIMEMKLDTRKLSADRLKSFCTSSVHQSLRGEQKPLLQLQLS